MRGAAVSINPAAEEWLARLPDRFRQAVVGGVAVAVQAMGDLKAIAVVGSLAEGTWDEESDTDFLFVREEQTWHTALAEIRRRWPPVSFIAGTVDSLRTKFAEGNDAAWAVRRSVPVYDPAGVFAFYLSKDPPLPRCAWVSDQAAKALDWREDRLQPWRILVLGQLLVLLRRGEMLTTKRAIRDALLQCEPSPEVVQAVHLAYEQRLHPAFSDTQRSLLQRAAQQLHALVEAAIPASRLAP
jgi:hypothetical protein